MTERSKKLRRQFTNLLEAEDAEQLIEALARKLREQDPLAFTGEIEFLDRFPAFFSAIDKSYEEYTQQNKLAFHNLERSSAELNTANIELEKLNLSIAAMLDGLGQGIFSFDRSGICSTTYSRACLSLIEGSPAGKHIADVLCLPDDMREPTQSLLDLVFAGSSSAFVNDFLALLPHEFPHSLGFLISLNYRPIFGPASSIQSILVIATDHTEEIAALKMSQKREEAATRVLRISSNRNIFTRFYQSAKIYFSATVATLSGFESLSNVKRDIHTLKGNASIFHLLDLAGLLHVIETELEHASTIEEAREILAARTPDARRALDGVRSEAIKIFGENFDRQGSIRTLPLDLLRSFANELKRSERNDALTDQFVSLLMGEPVRHQLAAFDIGLQELADRYGCKVMPCVFSGENFTLLSENYSALFASFTHVARNIIAHAIDSPEDRQKWHKPPVLGVTIETKTFMKGTKKWVSLSFTDDGKGIDVVRLRKKLRTCGNTAATDAASDDEIVQHIFDGSLSTRDEVDELSGRGVGMDAIKAEAESLGGTVRAESELHRFTRIVVEVPVIWN